jgi:predicted ATPase
MLDSPDCRLLTLAGPGGIGKTRLALATAAARVDAFAHGACFVDLTPLTTADFLISSITQTLKLSFDGDPRLALLDYLREKELLLLLDNFEHVLEGAVLLTEIVADAPGVKILVTSRERLRLRAERVYEVAGLAFPQDAAASDFAAFDAVRMLVACASYTQPDFEVAETDRAAVTDICRLVGGMPLGIELAAAWLHTVPAEVIATELAANLDFLQTTMRDTPARHRSMRAVFEHSWRLLMPAEQAAFTRLAVFHGGFTRGAAQAVAGAELHTLATLIDKSLLRVDAAGRYSFHELLRQFAEEKLAADAEAHARTCDSHSDFFLQFMQQRTPALTDHRQLTALKEIEPELDNIREAWNWAVGRQCWQRLRQAAHAVLLMLDWRSPSQEGVALFSSLAAALAAPAAQPLSGRLELGLLGVALMWQGWLLCRLGQVAEGSSYLAQSRPLVLAHGEPFEIVHNTFNYVIWFGADVEQAQAMLEQSWVLARDSGYAFGTALIIEALGSLQYEHGAFVEAQQRMEAALAAWRAIGHPFGTSSALNYLGRIALALGHYPEAKRLQQESLAIRRSCGIQLPVALCLDDLGEIACTVGDFDEAAACYRQSLDLYRDLGSQGHQAWALSGLGETALGQGNLTEAARWLAQTLALFEQNGSTRGLARAHNLLGDLALRQGQVDQAHQHWHSGLAAAARIRESSRTRLLLEALARRAKCMAETGQAEPAAQLLALILTRDGLERRAQDKARAILAELETQLPADVFAAARARGQALELGATVAAMLAEGAA